MDRVPGSAPPQEPNGETLSISAAAAVESPRIPLPFAAKPTTSFFVAITTGKPSSVIACRTACSLLTRATLLDPSLIAAKVDLVHL